MFLTIDVVFIFKIILSALAILFAFNTNFRTRERRWHTEARVIQCDTKRYNSAGKIPRWDVIAVSYCFDKFNHGTGHRAFFPRDCF